MNSRVCPVCGRTFERHHKQIYCSMECVQKAKAQQRTELNHKKEETKRRYESMQLAVKLYQVAENGDAETVIEEMTEMIYNYKLRKGRKGKK